VVSVLPRTCAGTRIRLALGEETGDGGTFLPFQAAPDHGLRSVSTAGTFARARSLASCHERRVALVGREVGESPSWKRLWRLLCTG
jgi:hypothetical protein